MHLQKLLLLLIIIIVIIIIIVKSVKSRGNWMLLKTVESSSDQ